MPCYLLLVLLSVSFLSGVPSAAQADSYTFTTINFPGSPDTRAFKINNEGQLVGWYNSGGFQHGFLYEADNFTTLDVPFANAYYTDIAGINNTGQMVGAYGTGGSTHGFLYGKNSFKKFDVPFPGVTATVPLGINEFSQVDIATLDSPPVSVLSLIVKDCDTASQSLKSTPRVYAGLRTT